LTSLVGAAPASAGPANIPASKATAVLDWNMYAINALMNPLSTTVPAPPVPGAGQPPGVASLHLAMVQGAVYDAVNAIAGGYEPYLQGVPHAPASASKRAAVATAAHHVLVGLVPALPQEVRDWLDDLYADYLAAIGDSQRKTDGIAIGAATATLMLAARANDGRYVPDAFTVGTDKGEWRTALPLFVNDPFAWVKNVTPFTLRSTSQFRTRGPLNLSSEAYAREFRQVKRLGAATGSSRTSWQTDLAQFFSVSPVGFENRALREIAAANGLSTADQARLFARTSMGAADALINCWDDKEYWHFWRPITAIQEAGHDGNPMTKPKADWLPFFATPPYPDHPSGYNCFTGSMMHTARRFFGTNEMTFALNSPASTTPRIYTQFTDVLRDTIRARIYMGIHFRTPDVQGVNLGRRVARWIDNHFFQPTD
jgi:hypothetical protein